MLSFTEIPRDRPSTPLLDRIDSPAQLRELDRFQLVELADELRAYVLYCTGRTGGHFGGNLGVVELSIALHYSFDTPHDRLVWDVGHQGYPHKILTGRREAMLSLRQQDGLSGFLRRAESPYDCFGAGHSSTSISAALGMALAARQQQEARRVVAVIGDGAMTAGMAFEALSHAAHTRADMLVVLNDNQMSISRNQGGVATYLSRVWASRLYTSMRAGSKKMLDKIPPARELARRTEEHVKGMLTPGTLFEEMGFNYIGPADGHDLPELVNLLGNLRDLPGPQLLHALTRKGRGYVPAEKEPVTYHAISKIEPLDAPPRPAPGRRYQDVFGSWLCDMAEADPRLVGITPAMREGSGMVEFSERFPERFFDVAIAELHAMTLAGGMACGGLKPVVAIYSTFLQRAYDQLIHDVALQNLDVLFGIDRAGLVGEDGATHSGSFDLSFLRCIPNLVVMAPSDENEARQLLYTGYCLEGPAAVRYPRGQGPGVEEVQELEALPLGRGRLLRRGREVAILAFGAPCKAALEAAEKLDASVADMRFVKPLDAELIGKLAREHRLLVTVEESAVMGGAGSGVQEHLATLGSQVPVLPLGLPDRFISHGRVQDQLAACGLDGSGIEQSIRRFLLVQRRRAKTGESPPKGSRPRGRAS